MPPQAPAAPRRLRPVAPALLAACVLAEGLLAGGLLPGGLAPRGALLAARDGPDGPGGPDGPDGPGASGSPAPGSAPGSTPGSAPAAGGAPSWPGFLGPRRDGKPVADEPLAPWGAEASGPPIRWSREVGEGFSGPVLDAGVLVLHHRLGKDEIIEGLDSGSGEPLWKHAYSSGYRDAYGADDDGPRATPALAGGRVHALGAEGKLITLELRSGRVLWQKDLVRDLGAEAGYFGFGSSPLHDGERLIVQVGGAGGAGIVAFDPGDGRLLWKAPTGEASYSSPIEAEILGAPAVLCFTRGGLAALRPGTGEVLLQFPWRARIQASVNAALPVVLGDRVFITASYQTGAALLQLSRDGGKDGAAGEGSPLQARVLWSGDDALSAHYATPVALDGVLYGFDGRQEGRPELRAVDAESGRVLWSEGGIGGGALLGSAGQLLILSTGGELILAPASKKGFHPAARARILEGPVRAPPALAGGRLYARGARRLAALDLHGRAAPPKEVR